MKTIISTIFLCVLLSFIPELRAQNIQLHYDFGRSLYDKDLKERPLLTSTVEKFHPDTWGSHAVWARQPVRVSLPIWTIPLRVLPPPIGR